MYVHAMQLFNLLRTVAQIEDFFIIDSHESCAQANFLVTFPGWQKLGLDMHAHSYSHDPTWDLGGIVNGATIQNFAVHCVLYSTQSWVAVAYW